MRLPWAASIVTQAIYAAVLWRSGQRDLWTWYMGIVAGCGVILWPLTGNAYFWPWVITHVALEMPAQLAASWEIAQRSKEPAWVFTGLQASMFFIACLFFLSPVQWPVSRRANHMLMYMSTFLSAGIVTGAYLGKAPINYGVIGYCLIDVIHSVAELFMLDRRSLTALNVLYLTTTALFFSTVVLQQLISRRRIQYYG